MTLLTPFVAIGVSCNVFSALLLYHFVTTTSAKVSSILAG